MRRLGAVAGLVAAALLGVGMPAAAADRASLTGVKSEGESVTGVLTVRAPVPLSDVRLRADVGGERRPVEISDEVRVQRTVMLVIDTSGSMGESGMATVRSAVRTFLRSAPTDVEVGVASFAATSGVDLQPTTRKRQVLRNVDGLTSDGDTDLFGGVTKATKELARYDGDRSIVLLSDGADTIAANPRAALGRASRTVRRNDVRLDVVRFNTDDPAAVRSLARLARAGDGGVVAAGNGRAVARAFGAAAGALESQVSFTVQLDRPLAGRAPVVLTGTAPGVDFVARGTARPGELGSSAGEEATPGTAAEEASGTEQLVVDRTGWYRVPAFGAAALALALFLAGVAYLLPRKTRREQRVEAIEGYLPWAAPTAGPS
jgi:tight adherence protein B